MSFPDPCFGGLSFFFKFQVFLFLFHRESLLEHVLCPVYPSVIVLHVMWRNTGTKNVARHYCPIHISMFRIRSSSAYPIPQSTPPIDSAHISMAQFMRAGSIVNSLFAMICLLLSLKLPRDSSIWKTRFWSSRHERWLQTMQTGQRKYLLPMPLYLS